MKTTQPAPIPVSGPSSHAQLGPAPRRLDDSSAADGNLAATQASKNPDIRPAPPPQVEPHSGQQHEGPSLLASPFPKAAPVLSINSDPEAPRITREVVPAAPAPASASDQSQRSNLNTMPPTASVAASKTEPVFSLAPTPSAVSTRTSDRATGLDGAAAMVGSALGATVDIVPNAGGSAALVFDTNRHENTPVENRAHGNGKTTVSTSVPEPVAEVRPSTGTSDDYILPDPSRKETKEIIKTEERSESTKSAQRKLNRPETRYELQPSSGQLEGESPIRAVPSADRGAAHRWQTRLRIPHAQTLRTRQQSRQRENRF